MEVFPKRKELASLRQLFVLHGKISIFLHALPLNAGTCSGGWGVNFALLVFGLICFCGCFHPLWRAKQCCVKNLRPHFLSVKWRERYGALKRKSCLSEASSFPLAECPTGIAQKVQTAVFLFCYLFLSADRKKKVRITYTFKPPEYTHKAVYRTHAW